MLRKAAVTLYTSLVNGFQELATLREFLVMTDQTELLLKEKQTLGKMVDALEGVKCLGVGDPLTEILAPWEALEVSSKITSELVPTSKNSDDLEKVKESPKLDKKRRSLFSLRRPLKIENRRKSLCHPHQKIPQSWTMPPVDAKKEEYYGWKEIDGKKMFVLPTLNGCYNCGSNHKFKFCDSKKNKFCYICGIRGVHGKYCPRCSKTKTDNRSFQKRIPRMTRVGYRKKSL